MRKFTPLCLIILFVNQLDAQQKEGKILYERTAQMQIRINDDDAIINLNYKIVNNSNEKVKKIVFVDGININDSCENNDDDNVLQNIDETKMNVDFEEEENDEDDDDEEILNNSAIIERIDEYDDIAEDFQGTMKKLCEVAKVCIEY